MRNQFKECIQLALFDQIIFKQKKQLQVSLNLARDKKGIYSCYNYL